jgi:hypothetical protein
MTLAGSEAYVAGLTYYGSSKEGVKRKVPNAILIAEELGERFPDRSRAKKGRISETLPCTMRVVCWDMKMT